MRHGPPDNRKWMETRKSHDRRVREGWYDKYCPATENGIDIGCSDDPVHDHFDQWDMQFGDGDAVLMAGLAPETYHTVYTSHILEHVSDPPAALRRWFELVRPGGHLIINVPHRDLYEKRTLLPSIWNPEHASFWLPDRDDPPHTFSLLRTLQDALRGDGVTVDYEIIHVRVLNDNWIPLAAAEPADGEYAIEAVIKKLPQPIPAAVAANKPVPPVIDEGAAQILTYPAMTTVADRAYEARRELAKAREEIARLKAGIDSMRSTWVWRWRTKLVGLLKR
jgi:predicted SAM-dependent methyltransferase